MEGEEEARVTGMVGKFDSRLRDLTSWLVYRVILFLAASASRCKFTQPRAHLVYLPCMNLHILINVTQQYRSERAATFPGPGWIKMPRTVAAVVRVM